MCGCELRDGPGLALESLAELRIRCERCWKNLDGHGAIEPRVTGAIDLSHAARAEGGHDFVRPGAPPLMKKNERPLN